MECIRPALLTLMMLAGMAVTLPARTDQTCQAALTTISKATDTLTKMQNLLAGMQKRQQQAIAGAVTPPDVLEKRGTYVSIDLQSKANHILADDLHDTVGNNLKGMPEGEQKMAGVLFNIGSKLVHLRGANALALPEKVEGIPVGAAVGRLHILHGTGYNVDEGIEIAAYVMHYADGTTERLPIIYGEDIHDWWGTSNPQDLKRAKVAWKGSNPAAESSQMVIALYAREWINPHPDKQILSIDFVSRNTDCDPFLVALSIEKP